MRAAAKQIALPIPEEDLALVNDDMARISAIAAFLMEFPLDQDVEAAPVFVP